MKSATTAALTLLAAAALAGCDQIPDRQAPPPAPAAAAPVAQPTAPPDPADLFFVGRWATGPDLCDDGAWVITAQELRTAGEVACKFQRLTKTPAGYEVPATCWAEGPPREHRLQFAYAQSAQALLISEGPFADAGLIRCPGSAYPPPEPAAPGTPGGLPDDGTPVSEAPFAPESAQGAGQVLQTYFAHLSQRQHRPAWALWRNKGEGSGLSADAFARSFAGYDSLNAQIGAPGRIEGAAGSLYVRVPIQLYGRLKDGTEVHRLGHAVLRRANEIPGATPAERAWRIESMELRPRG